MRYLLLIFSAFLITSCNLGEMVTDATKSTKPTETEIAHGLVQALVKGMAEGVQEVSAPNGFLSNDFIKIPFPETALRVKTALETVGADQLVDDVVESLNHAAEDASGVAKDVLVHAVKQLTIQDAVDILFGPENAATNYLRESSSNLLLSKFTPIIQNSLEKVHATKYWSAVIGKYNQVNVMQVFGPPVETDLTRYAATSALSGLFYMVEKEEKKIREDPIARTTALLQKVFGYADRQSDPTN